jgi:hypothetical protein
MRLKGIRLKSIHSRIDGGLPMSYTQYACMMIRIIAQMMNSVMSAIAQMMDSIISSNNQKMDVIM